MKSLRSKLSPERIAELVEKNCTVLSDDEWNDFLSQLFIISDCNETRQAVTWHPYN